LFYWLMKRVLIGPLLHLLFRPWVRGAEHVPSSGAAILASNHLAVIDSFFLPLVLDREIVFIGKNEYFTGRGLKGRLTAGFMRGDGTIPVDRSGGKATEAALNTGLNRLQDGKLFGIYPEGTRSPDGRLYRGKTGVARLALESGAPVIPVAMVGTAAAKPIGRKIPKIMRIGMVIGEPLDFSRYPGHGERPVHPALGHRRDHVRHHEPVRPGVRRHLRRHAEGAHRHRAPGGHRPERPGAHRPGRPRRARCPASGPAGGGRPGSVG